MNVTEGTRARSASQDRQARADAAAEVVHRWLTQASDTRNVPSSKLLARLVAAPAGLEFTVAFVDGVMRPEDPRVAAQALRRAAQTRAPFLTWPVRVALGVGGRLAPLVPWIAVPAARAVVRRLVGSLVLDSRPNKLGAGLEKIAASGCTANVNLLGEAVLGREQASARLTATLALIERPDIDYVSLKVSSVVAPHSPWSFDIAVDEIREALTPVYEAAARTGTFVNLDMEEYRDLDLTIEVFTRLLSEDRFAHVYAGIVLQAYLPESLAAMERLQEWAHGRIASGGAPIKVRVVKGANLSMERVDAELHGWPLATWPSKAHTDAHYKRLLEWALTPERVTAIRIGVAGHNLFDIAHAWLLANERGVQDAIEFEMLVGMADAVAPAIRSDVGTVRLYTPVVAPSEFDVALAYLVRRLEELANPDNYLGAAFAFDTNPDSLAREEARFRASVALIDEQAASTFRGADGDVGATPGVFRNQADTDPSTRASRDLARELARRIPTSRLGTPLVEAHTLTTGAQAERVLATAKRAGRRWGAVSPQDRADLLDRVALALEAARDQLIEVMASECGKTLEQADPEVSEVVDFARYYAHSARALGDVDGASPRPRTVTLVTPPWNFPVAIPGGGVLAALAAGSAVILKPADQARRCSAVFARVLWDAGVDPEVLQLTPCDEGEVGTRLVLDDRVDQIILTGGYATAELFTKLRPTARVLGETSGKNAIIVTPSADLDLAVKDIVNSAFGHAGQKCSAASIVVLVGSVAKSRRFRDQLRDAAGSLICGTPDALDSQVGPLIEPPSGSLLRGLTRLDRGESWLLEPTARAGNAALWSPGIREGVSFGAPSHTTEYFGPVLAVMTAPTLDAAIDIVNAVDYGLTSGLHSLDQGEIDHWLARVHAGNLYINRGTTGAIVQRQPFGGWKRSVVGPSAKAGGPHYVQRLTDWSDAVVTSAMPPAERVAELLALATPADAEWLRAAFASDAHAWSTRYAQVTDPSGLEAERNVYRYVPCDAEVRVSADSQPRHVLRVLGAAAMPQNAILVSFAELPSPSMIAALAAAGLRHVVEDDRAWCNRLATRRSNRVRVVGSVPLGARAAHTTLFADPVTSSGELEIFPFVHEQAVSMTAHRFGTPSRLAQSVAFTDSRATS